MANAKLTGLDDYVATLDRISGTWEKAAGKSIHTGAGILADDVRAQIEALPIRSGKTGAGELAQGVTQIEKTALLNGLGIAKMRNDDGLLNVRIGFDGYDSVKTKAYPKGHAVSMIARAVNSGTSWSVKIPFINRAYTKSRKEIELKMQETFLKELGKNNG